MSLPRLYSAQEVQEMFPAGAKPSIVTIRARARQRGLCRILGRHMAFTTEDATSLIGEFSFQKIVSGHAAKSGTSYVYFIQCQNMVKIGRAKDPERRLQQIQVGCPFDVTLVWTCHGGKCDEQYFHRIFAECRRKGEWFELTPRLEIWLHNKIYERGLAHLKDKAR